MPFIFRVIIVFILIIGLEYYFFRKMSRSVENLFPKLNKEKFKRYRRLFIIFINLYPVGALLYGLFIYFSGKVDTIPPESFILDYFFIYPFWIALMLILQTALYFLFLDIVKLPILLLFKKYKEKILKIESAVIFGILIFFLVYIPARVIYDYNTVSVSEFEYRKPGLPESLEDFKIVLISDVQADRYTDETRLERYIDKVNELEPDLVLISGDIITGTPRFIDLGAEYLGRIDSRYGVFSCVGDHDNWAYRSDYNRSVREITSALGKADVEMIDNGNAYLDIDGARVGITFITNTYVRRIYNGTIDSLAAANSENDLSIFLTHQPVQELIDRASKHDYDLFFAGHTHGGQVTLIFPFTTLTPTRIETKYIKGEFRFGDMLAIVNGGLGMSLMPLRYNSTPDISLIRVNSEL